MQMSANCKPNVIQRWNTYRNWARVRGVAALTCHGVIANKTKQNKTPQNTKVVNIATLPFLPERSNGAPTTGPRL
jgi:hypothetical protein